MSGKLAWTERTTQQRRKTPFRRIQLTLSYSKWNKISCYPLSQRTSVLRKVAVPVILYTCFVRFRQYFHVPHFYQLKCMTVFTEYTFFSFGGLFPLLKITWYSQENFSFIHLKTIHSYIRGYLKFDSSSSQGYHRVVCNGNTNRQS